MTEARCQQCDRLFDSFGSSLCPVCTKWHENAGQLVRYDPPPPTAVEIDDLMDMVGEVVAERLKPVEQKLDALLNHFSSVLQRIHHR